MNSHDRTLLRELATRVAEIAAQPVMAERRAEWRRHNRLQPGRPMLLVFPEGSWRELLPDEALACEDAAAWQMEQALRMRLYYADHLYDDTVIERTWVVHTVIHQSGWGLDPRYTPATAERGAWGFAPVIHGPEDLEKLRYPEVVVDEAATVERLAQAQELFGDILDVQRRGVQHISFHLTRLYCDLRGLDQVMWDMYDRPEMVHAAMSFLTEGHRRLVQQYVALNLLSLNNDGTYHSSGGVGYTDELPAPGFDPARVRPCDMWASAESQEMAQVSPAMHKEFVLQYEKELLAPFGLTGYGCCEDLTRKLDAVLTIPHIRRISISPFANVVACAERLGNRAIYSWKPHPAMLVGTWDGARVRDYIRRTVEVAAANGCVLEIILKDTHTCEWQPARFTWWTEMAREAIG